MPDFRLLLTGPRIWPDPGAIERVLKELHREHGGQLLVVHGACPAGADQIAAVWCAANNVRTETHPANWHVYGRPAGMLRNQAMVNLGANLAVAFPAGKAAGTYGCVNIARKAGIPTVVHRLSDDPPRRIQRTRIKGDRLPPGAVSVIRPGKWGNDYDWTNGAPTPDRTPTLYGGRAGAVALHRNWLAARPDLIAEVRRELQGRDLACYCPLAADGEPDVCHGATLLATANGDWP